ncbi:hypothetical protein CPB85DRAFT_892472 [Mucidula mucida]|nr:hypothetical protein CPB85DRAFT_892472 [Mucidula mucida]
MLPRFLFHSTWWGLSPRSCVGRELSKLESQNSLWEFLCNSILSRTCSLDVNYESGFTATSESGALVAHGIASWRESKKGTTTRKNLRYTSGPLRANSASDDVLRKVVLPVTPLKYTYMPLEVVAQYTEDDGDV